MAVSHVFSNAIADGTNTNIVRPSDWNSAHNQYQTITGNTLGASTVSGTNIVLGATQNVSLSVTGSTISVVGPDLTPYLTTAALSNHNHGASAANGSFGFQTLSFSNANGVSFATSAGSAVVGSVETSYAASNHSHGNPTLNLTNISGTTASNSAGLTLSLSAGAAGGVTVSWMQNFPLISATSAARELGSTSHAAPFVVPLAITASYFRLGATMSTNSTSLASTANTTFSASYGSTFNVVLYTQLTGASSQSLGSYASASTVSAFLHSVQANSNGSEYSVSHFVTFPGARGVSSTFSSSYASTSASVMVNSAWMTDFTGLRFVDFPFATSLSAGNYWAIIGVSSTNDGQTGLTRNSCVAAGYLANRQPDSTAGFMGSALNATIQLIPGLGSFTTAGGGTTASLGFSNISSKQSHIISHFQMGVN